MTKKFLDLIQIFFLWKILRPKRDFQDFQDFLWIQNILNVECEHENGFNFKFVLEIDRSEDWELNVNLKENSENSVKKKVNSSWVMKNPAKAINKIDYRWRRIRLLSQFKLQGRCVWGKLRKNLWKLWKKVKNEIFQFSRLFRVLKNLYFHDSILNIKYVCMWRFFIHAYYNQMREWESCEYSTSDAKNETSF